MARRVRALASWLAAACVGSSLAAPAPEVPVVVVSQGDKLTWRGIPADEPAGAQGAGMLYPAPNAGGLLVAILTHAAIVQGSRESDRKARQDAADKALAPLATQLDGLRQPDLVAAAAARVPRQLALRTASQAGAASEGLVLEVQPLVAMPQDLSHIVLDTAMKIYPAGTPGQPIFANLVRVVSAAKPPDSAAAAWAEDDGRALKGELEGMLAHGLEVALRVAEGRAPKEMPSRTFRYQFSGEERMERGQAVAHGCARVVIRTLRDWLMSVPVPRADGEPACVDPYRLADTPSTPR